MLKTHNLIPFISARIVKKEIILIVLNSNLNFALQVYKKHVNYQYKILSCVSGIDLLGQSYRFSVVYDLLSLVHNSRIRIKTFINEVTPVFSATKTFINAGWWEREIWDLFGVYFEKHTDLRRLLTDYGFEGHPMRKDFPVFGYTELKYSETKKRVISEPIQLSQEFRNFQYDAPW